MGTVDRPTVLLFAACYLPGNKAGGPVRSIANLVEILGDTFDFRIITADRDLGDSVPYENIVADAWNQVGKARVFYASAKQQSLLGLAHLIRQTPHDIVYLNSFFHPAFTQRPLWARSLRLIPRRPIIIAPRGEFSQGALGLKSWKKRPYMALAWTIGLYRNVTWQASSAAEARDIRRELWRDVQRVDVAPQIAVAPDLAVTASGNQSAVSVREGDGPLRVVFMSRIARMKNLEFVLRVLKSVETPVELCIYGAIEDESYWKACSELAKTMDQNVAVTYGGLVTHDRVVETLSGHDLFFLPTLGENFGHVIFEALAAGLPVLVSDRTPWRSLKARGVGWDLPLTDILAFVAVIENQAALNGSERAAQRLRAREFAVAVAADEETVARNLALFRDCLH